MNKEWWKTCPYIQRDFTGHTSARWQVYYGYRLKAGWAGKMTKLIFSPLRAQKHTKLCGGVGLVLASRYLPTYVGMCVVKWLLVRPLFFESHVALRMPSVWIQSRGDSTLRKPGTQPQVGCCIYMSKGMETLPCGFTLSLLSVATVIHWLLHYKCLLASFGLIS